MIKVLHVVGARPNFMKVAPIMAEMARYPESFDQHLVHTGQHYDDRLSKVFFDDLGLPQPNVYLGIGAGTQTEQIARIALKFEPVLREYEPDWVVVVGDVTSTLACALTAVKADRPVAHVEAGLRSFDRTMPEEINRVVTDHLATLHFTTEPSANENLQREGISAAQIHYVGNVMIDTLVRLLPLAEQREILTELGLRATNGGGARRARATEVADYVLVTLHRPANVDELATLKELLQAINEVAREVPVIFPVHPRTRARIAELFPTGLGGLAPNLKLTEPLGYLDFLALMRHAAVVITDSGGIQEETTYLGVPCLTVRPNTERPITVEAGTNRLVSGERAALVAAALDVLQSLPTWAPPAPPAGWDGRAALRIVKVLRNGVIGQNRER